ncbi:unnamed protein product [Closterium sp. Naga37s-1]|nr:unnamed protein product [Closterium sp. Naga37s-1]
MISALLEAKAFRSFRLLFRTPASSGATPVARVTLPASIASVRPELFPPANTFAMAAVAAAAPVAAAGGVAAGAGAEAAEIRQPRKAVRTLLSREQAEGAGARVRRSIGRWVVWAAGDGEAWQGTGNGSGGGCGGELGQRRGEWCEEKGIGTCCERPELRQLDPFLMLDEFKAADAAAGFPDHPHRGFETVSYLIQGSFVHEDFNGHKGQLHAGDVQVGAGWVVWWGPLCEWLQPCIALRPALLVSQLGAHAMPAACNHPLTIPSALPLLSARAVANQWMTAGRGVVHSEMPGEGPTHGLQLWVNLAAKDKM